MSSARRTPCRRGRGGGWRDGDGTRPVTEQAGRAGALKNAKAALVELETQFNRLKQAIAASSIMDATKE